MTCLLKSAKFRHLHHVGPDHTNAFSHVSVFVSIETKQNIFDHTSIFVLSCPVHTTVFTLKQPKMLMEMIVFSVFKSLCFHLTTLETEDFQNNAFSKGS